MGVGGTEGAHEWHLTVGRMLSAPGPRVNGWRMPSGKQGTEAASLARCHRVGVFSLQRALFCYGGGADSASLERHMGGNGPKADGRGCHSGEVPSFLPS